MKTIQTDLFSTIETEEHHPHGGSSLERQELCPFSFTAEQGYENESSEASERGVKLHKACETKNLDRLDEHDRQQCLWAMECVVDICQEYTILEAYKEKKVFIKDEEGNTLSYGTADVLLVVEGTDGARKVVVIDYKFGYTPVSVKNNVQLQSYGVGGCQEFDAVECDYYIVQPALEYCDMDSFNDVDVPYNRICDIIDDTELVNPEAHPSKQACKYCKHRFNCEHRVEAQNSLMLKTQCDIATMTPSEVADILDKIETVEGLMKDMKKEAEQYVKDNGGTIDGRYKVIKAKGRSKAITAEEAYRIAPESAVRKHATVSKTALEKAYVEANYVKGQNLKKDLKTTFKAKVSPLLKYGEDYDKVIKIKGKSK